MNFMSVLSSLAPHSAGGLGGGAGRGGGGSGANSGGGGLVGGLSVGLSGSSRSERHTVTSSTSASRDTYISKESWERQMNGASPLNRDELDCCVMQYLLLSGYQETAEKLAEESNCNAIFSGIDSNNFDEENANPPPTIMSQEMKMAWSTGGAASGLSNRVKLRELVTGGRLAEAIQLTQRLYPELLEGEFGSGIGDGAQPGQLYFHLRQQQLIELIREGKVEAALEFAQNQMADLLMLPSNMNADSDSAGFKANAARLVEMERTMALLAFEEPEKSSFGGLMSQKHREKIAAELNRAILLAEDVSQPDSRLEAMLKVLLWSEEELQRRRVHCPKMLELSTATLGPSTTASQSQHSLDDGGGSSH